MEIKIKLNNKGYKKNLHWLKHQNKLIKKMNNPQLRKNLDFLVNFLLKYKIALNKMFNKILLCKMVNNKTIIIR